MYCKSMTLIEAVSLCLSRAKSIYNNNWLITNDSSENSCRKSILTQSLEDYFDKVTGLENHVFTEICICLEGCLAMQIAEQIVDIKEGEVCLIFPGVKHAELPKKDSDYLAIWITFNMNIVALHLSGKNKNDGLFFTLDGFSIASSHEIRPIVMEIEHESVDKKPYYIDMTKMDIIKLLVSILRAIGDPYQDKAGQKTWKENVAIQVQDYVTRNYNRCIRLIDVSHELCISQNYINTLFKSVTGKTIIQYVEDFKIEKAKELLMEPERSISSVSLELGYFDQYHFCKIFKKETGYTPTQYRRRDGKLNKDLSLK